MGRNNLNHFKSSLVPKFYRDTECELHKTYSFIFKECILNIGFWMSLQKKCVFYWKHWIQLV